jgi:inorganic phosphate transporter, PiT family
VHALILLVIALSLFYTYTNGFQDGSSVTATAIASRAMAPWQAVALVSLAEFLGACFGGSAVAATIQSITSYPDDPLILPVLASGLTAAIVWNYFTRMIRIPSSSTHALIGGVVGAIVSQADGFRYIEWGSPSNLVQSTGLWKVIISLFVSPCVGFVGGYAFFLLMVFALRNTSTQITRWLKLLQAGAITLLGFAHGANDSQKAMGVIMLALNSRGAVHLNSIPDYVRLLTGLALVAGICSIAPGIVRRVGSGIFKLQSVHALVAQMSAAAIVLFGSETGGPVSASQVIASTVVGVGAAQRSKGVHWKAVQDLVAAWLFTIPGAAITAMVLQRCLFHLL